MLQLRLVAGVLSVGLLVLGAGRASAQTYPTKPIRMVNSGAGGSQDFLVRILAQGLTGLLEQPVIVDNRTPLRAAVAVAQAQPDGYTLLVVASGLWIGPLLQSNTPYDAIRDFAPISLLITQPNILSVHPSLPVKSVKDLIALAKSQPGKLNYGSTSIGSSNHLAAELFKAMAGVNIVRIAYKDGASVGTGVVSNEVQMMFSTSGLAKPLIASGKLRGLAVTLAEPTELFPELPTVASVLPGYEAGGPTALLATAKTSAAIITRLNREVVRVLNQPDLKEKILATGAQPVGSTPQALAANLQAEVAKWGKLIKDLGIKTE